MEVRDAIQARRTIRAFKPAPVPRKTLEELLELCLRAPNSFNMQPWEFAVVQGSVLEELKRRLGETRARREPQRGDFALPMLDGAFLERARETGKLIYEILGIAREDKERRLQYWVDMIGFFGAPTAIFFYAEKSHGPLVMMDIGIVLQTIALVALGYGLGTCIVAEGIRYPDIIRDVLKLPESKLVACAIGLGYPDPNAPINRFRSPRAPLSTFATWLGFD